MPNVSAVNLRVAGVPNPCTTSSYVAYHYSTGSTADINTTSYLFTYHTGSASALGSKYWLR